MKEDLVRASLKSESYREYDFDGRIYRIENPVELVFRRGGSTHRIVDGDGVVHCLPGPGYRGCVLRWKNKDGYDPVEF
jgi:hypothetical protein